jgi:hypothetical protein
LIPARRLFAAARLLITAGAAFLVVCSATRAQTSSANCEEAAEVAVLPSPLTPWIGAPLRVMFVAEKPLEGELSLIAPDGTVAAKSRDHLDGPASARRSRARSPWRARSRPAPVRRRR